MSTSAVLIAPAEGGIIGDGRTGANLAIGAGALGTVLAVLHLATSSGAPVPATGSSAPSWPSHWGWAQCSSAAGR